MATPEGRHFYQNEAFTNLFGEIGDNSPATIFVDKDVSKDVFKTIMAGGRWAGEVTMFAKDKRVLNILLRAYANRDVSGRIIGLVGIHTDITECRRTEDALRKNEAFISLGSDPSALRWKQVQSRKPSQSKPQNLLPLTCTVPPRLHCVPNWGHYYLTPSPNSSKSLE